MLRYFARSGHRTLSGERSLRRLGAELAEHLLTLMNDLERTYTPAEAAEVFGFAPSLLRRYAAIYEAVGGTIPHDRRGGRIYSQQVLKHFVQARERVKAGETVEDALRTFDLAAVEPVTDTQVYLDAKQVLSHLERVLASNERLEVEVAALRARVEQLAEVRVLPSGVTSERIDQALEVETQTSPVDGVMVKAARWLERRLYRKG